MNIFTIILIELINYYKECLNESKKEEIKSIKIIHMNNALNKKYEIEYSNYQIIKYLFKNHKIKETISQRYIRLF